MAIFGNERMVQYAFCLAKLGFGFVEFGTVIPKPQPGLCIYYRVYQIFSLFWTKNGHFWERTVKYLFGLAEVGFGSVGVGSVTPKPQPGWCTLFKNDWK